MYDSYPILSMFSSTANLLGQIMRPMRFAREFFQIPRIDISFSGEYNCTNYIRTNC